MPKNNQLIELLDYFDPTYETSLVYKSAYDFGERILAPYNKSLITMPTHSIVHPTAIWKEVADNGYFGARADAKYNGIGKASFLKEIAVTAAFSYHCPSIALSHLAHDDLGLGRILDWGSEELKDRYAHKCIIEGEAVALAMSEPNSGSDVMSMTTEAVQDGDYFIVNGLKTWITNGASAHVVVFYAKTGKDQITAFAVEKGTPGFTVNRKIGKNGMRGSETAELAFTDCRIHKNQMVGPLHGGKKVLGKGLNTERVKLAIAGKELAQYMFDKTCEYTQMREQFDAPIATFQSNAYDIADMGANLETMTEIIVLASHMHDTGHELTRQKAARSFLHVGVMVPQIALKCVELFGGNGLTDDYELISQYRNDSDLYMTGGGSIKMRKEILARSYVPKYDEEQELTREWRRERKEASRIILPYSAS